MIDTVPLKYIVDNRGTMIAANSLPFTVRRFFLLKDLKSTRGNHAHKALWELLVVISGSCKIYIDDGKCLTYKWLDNPQEGFIIPPLVWRTLDFFSSDCVILSLCSQELLEEDYIRDYEEFKEYVKCVIR